MQKPAEGLKNRLKAIFLEHDMRLDLHFPAKPVQKWWQASPSSSPMSELERGGGQKPLPDLTAAAVEAKPRRCDLMEELCKQ